MAKQIVIDDESGTELDSEDELIKAASLGGVNAEMEDDVDGEPDMDIPDDIKMEREMENARPNDADPENIDNAGEPGAEEGLDNAHGPDSDDNNDEDDINDVNNSSDPDDKSVQDEDKKPLNKPDEIKTGVNEEIPMKKELDAAELDKNNSENKPMVYHQFLNAIQSQSKDNLDEKDEKYGANDKKDDKKDVNSRPFTLSRMALRYNQAGSEIERDALILNYFYHLRLNGEIERLFFDNLQVQANRVNERKNIPNNLKSSMYRHSRHMYIAASAINEYKKMFES